MGTAAAGQQLSAALLIGADENRSARLTPCRAARRLDPRDRCRSFGAARLSQEPLPDTGRVPPLALSRRFSQPGGATTEDGSVPTGDGRGRRRCPRAAFPRPPGVPEARRGRRRRRGAAERRFPRTQPRGSAGTVVPTPRPRPPLAESPRSPPSSALPLVGPPDGAGAARGVLSVGARAVIASSPRASRLAPADAAWPRAVRPLRFQSPGAAGPRLGLREDHEEGGTRGTAARPSPRPRRPAPPSRPGRSLPTRSRRCAGRG